MREPLAARHRCYLCDADVERFVPYRGGYAALPGFIRERQVVGSDVDNFGCPRCGCHDRERHLAMYFDRLDLWSVARGGDVLHIAPERFVSRRLLEQRPSRYVRGDLTPSSPEVGTLDITALPFPDASFDLVLCNHVLEHVPDDGKALSELCRVLRPGARAVLQTPYSPLLERTYFDAAIDTDAGRLEFYGQEDHVRLYGRDLFEKIVAAGFELQLARHAEVLADLDASRFGVNPREELILARRPVSG